MGSGASQGLKTFIKLSCNNELRDTAAALPANDCHKLCEYIDSVEAKLLDNTFLQGCKMTYFPLPGRGIALQLALALGGIKFTNDVVPFAEWPSKKPSMPWLSMPVLELSNGGKVAQQRVILRLIGKCTALYPQDPLLAGRVDELVDVIEDIFVNTNSLGRGMEQAAKEAARLEGVTNGPVSQTLERVNAYIGAFGKGGCAVGDAMTIADVFVYCMGSNLISGFLDGVPPTALDRFPNIQAVRKMVATTPAVIDFLDKVYTGPLPDVYRTARDLDVSAANPGSTVGRTPFSVADLVNCKLTYFPIPGRGLAPQLALALGGVKFTNNAVPFAEWPATKPSTPWFSMPVLELADGTKIAQQRAILRMIGACTSLYPEDPLLAARVDELLDVFEDVTTTTMSLGQGLDKAEKEAARLEAVTTGSVAKLLERVDGYIGTYGKRGCAVGDAMTIADLFIYSSSSSFISGLLDGVPTTVLDKFSRIQAVRKNVATTPAVIKYLDEERQGPLPEVFKTARHLFISALGYSHF